MSSTKSSTKTFTQENIRTGNHYVVGDIQGCYDQLVALLEKVNFDDNNDKLWLTGDLVARGPKSLETLRLVKSMGDAATTILGNHDLHLLATYHGIKKVKANDKLEPLFAADDLDELIHWLKQQPMLAQIHVPGRKRPAIMTHAGISPNWTINQAIEAAKEVETILKGPECVEYLTNMYQNISKWHKSLCGFERFCYIVNSFTRMRYCYQDGELDFKEKNNPNKVNNPALVPWYLLAPKHWQQTDIMFGHFATLMGQCPISNIFALDTGCVWGHDLTMMRLNDNQYFTIR